MGKKINGSAGEHGGAREGGGRKAGDGKLYNHTVGFRNYVRQFTKASVDYFVKVRDDVNEDTRIRLEAAAWLVDRGHGRAPQSLPDSDTETAEVYENMEQVKAALLEQGIDYDRVPLLIEHVPVTDS